MAMTMAMGMKRRAQMARERRRPYQGRWTG
jgi:hypothetical protein